jgi:hypothetical protein
MMNATQGIGALENITKPEENIMQANFVDSGYPSNLSADDKAYIIKRLMDFSNEDFNPWANGATGLPLLIKEKYGRDL